MTLFDFENLNDVCPEPLEQLRNLVGDTPVRGFEDLSEGTNEEIAEYLKETIPEWHFGGCTEIRYAPDSPTFRLYNTALGAYFPGKRNIEIASAERFEDTGNMIDAIVHEVGHNVYESILEQKPDAIGEWENIYQDSIKAESTGFGFVSDYAKTSVFEDFAESYKAYVRDPELLKFMSEDKYNFMKFTVFEGQEYLRDSMAVSRGLPSSHLEGILTQDSGADLASMTRDQVLDTVGRNMYSSYVILSTEIEERFLAVTKGIGGEELFAGMYSGYILNGDDMLLNSPEQYRFMRDDIFNGIEFSDARKPESDGESVSGRPGTLTQCNQLDYYASCNQLDIVAISGERNKDYDEDEQLNPMDEKPDVMMLHGCARKCVECEVKSSDCTSY